MNVRLAGCALVAATALAAPQAAHADNVYAGFTCGFAATVDPTGTLASSDTRTGTVFDYFYSGTTGTNAGPDTVTVTCSIQINDANPGGADAVSVTATGTGVVVLPPTLVAFQAAPGDVVFACTEVTATAPDGTTKALVAGDDSCKESTEAGPAEAEPWDREAGAGPVEV
jgi:hypothetical protein